MPRRLLWDYQSGIGPRNRLGAGVGGLCGTFAATMHQPNSHHLESKGIVERRNGFFETSFMPGRTFTSPAHFNTQFIDWREGANRPIMRTTKERLINRVEADRAAMIARIAHHADVLTLRGARYRPRNRGIDSLSSF